MRFQVLFAIFAVSFGTGFQTGYNIGVLNTPIKVIMEWMDSLKFSEEDIAILISAANALLSVGGMVGGLMVGIFSDQFGRKGGLLVANMIVLVGVAFGMMAVPFEVVYLLLVSRFLNGVYCGLGGGLAPMYLSEVSPINRRGAIGSTYQLMLTIGILFSQVVGLEVLLGREGIWPYLIGLCAVPALFQLIGFNIVPESPKYYMERGKDEQATGALKTLYGEKTEEREAEMKQEIEASKAQPKVKLGELFKEKKYRKPLFIICTLMAAQQLSGINAVMFYSTIIFHSANFDDKDARVATIGIGVVNVLTTIVSLWLVEKFGRKCLLLFGFGGMCATTILLFLALFFLDKFSWASIACIVYVYMFVVFFASGAGSIPWLLGPELFAVNARPAALSLAVPTNWFFAFVVTMTFVPIQGGIGEFVFIFFIVFQGLSFVFIWFLVPETKNKPIEEITAMFE